MYLTPTWYSWSAMKQRCNNKNATRYPQYGGRGIKLCKRWNKFKNFLLDMGVRPIDRTIDRINNNGNYNKKNCRWATRTVQNSNIRKRKSKYSKIIKQKYITFDKRGGFFIARYNDLKNKKIIYIGISRTYNEIEKKLKLFLKKYKHDL